MSTRPTAPTPDTVLRALWDADFDLPHAAAALRISLLQLVLLLKQPGYAEPLEALHQAARQCLDLKAAKAVGTILDSLHTDLEACDDPAESRRIATALTKAINAATRLARATDRRSERSVTAVSAAGGAGVPPAILRDEPQHPQPHHTHSLNPQSEIRNPQSSLLAAAGQARAA